VRPPRRSREGPEDPENPQQIRAVAVALLARREHSIRELKQKLARRGYAADACDAVIEDLERRGLISEARFVESFVSHRSTRGQGPVRIRAELRQLDVGDELVDPVLDSGDVDWCELASAVRRRRFGQALPRDFAERAKQARFLQYRGFTQEQIRAALAGNDDESSR
jgi:regulatory protein